jgi:aspartyl-tRNA(Asn)/glutamyl-tRNA(Gln) amidotransferase subunit A
MQSRWDDYFESSKPQIATGALVSGADYVQAQRVRGYAQRELNRVFEDVDLIVTPTTVVPAPAYEGDSLRVDSLLGTLFTTYWNAVGNPVLAVPIGFNVDGMPLSMQIAGRPLGEAQVLSAGNTFQHKTDWHLRTPRLATLRNQH